MKLLHLYTLFVVLLFVVFIHGEGPLKKKNVPECVHWKKTFVGVKSPNLHQECKLPDGRPVCCAAVEDTTWGRGVGAEEPHIDNHLSRCVTNKTYNPSRYELAHFEKAAKLSSIGDHDQRLNALLEMLSSTDELRLNRLWLHQVGLLMAPQTAQQRRAVTSRMHTQLLRRPNSIVLSHFTFTKTCQGSPHEAQQQQQWIEFIEPLSLHGRHPFSLAACQHISAVKRAYSPNATSHGPHGLKKSSLMDVDYLLLQSGSGLYAPSQDQDQDQGESYMNSRPTSPSSYPHKHFLFDAGSSTFDSSLFWLTCAYSQVGMSFDRVFSFEKSLLEPTDFWRRVPSKWLPYWSFYNIPIATTAESSSSQPSPLSFIEAVARPEDFVSFKLDVDHADTEVHLAQELASLVRRSPIDALVDEFFFEIHFRCEVMTQCGWRLDIPHEVAGLVMDRLSVMEFFAELRREGVRAHFWP